jgi:hypothetical protein
MYRCVPRLSDRSIPFPWHWWESSFNYLDYLLK